MNVKKTKVSTYSTTFALESAPFYKSFEGKHFFFFQISQLLSQRIRGGTKKKGTSIANSEWCDHCMKILCDIKLGFFRVTAECVLLYSCECSTLKSTLQRYLHYLLCQIDVNCTSTRLIILPTNIIWGAHQNAAWKIKLADNF